MKQFKDLWSNSAVNNLTVAVISGFGVYSFVTYVSGMLFGDILTEATHWNWTEFWTQLLVLVVVLLSAWWVKTQSRG